jgi:hypothetical protein
MGGKLCLFLGVRTLPLLTCSIRTLPCLCLMIYLGLVHDKFCVVLYDRYRGTFSKCRARHPKCGWIGTGPDYSTTKVNAYPCAPPRAAQQLPIFISFFFFILCFSLFLTSFHVGQGCVDQECLLHTWLFILRFFEPFAN